jgi:DNA repair protein RecO (recombination protein O)
MITKTRGIVLNYIKYGDTSIICKIYTEQFGLQSYIINGIRNSKSKNIGLFQLLNILDLVVYHKKTSGLQRIKESKLDYAYKTLHLDMKKISVCFFLSEFLTRISQNDDDQKDNFDFIKDSLIVFDRLEVNYSNFHIQFLIKLSKYFGIDIGNSKHLTDENLKDDINLFVDACINNSYEVKIKSNNILRNNVINLIIEHYSRNLDININLNSTNILKEIFN